MTGLMSRLPWFVSAPAVVAATLGMVGLSYYFTSPLFFEECRNERNLLTGKVDASVCSGETEPASQVAAAAEPGTPAPTAPAGASAATPAPAAAAKAGTLAEGRFANGEPGHQGSGQAQVQRLPDGSLNLYLSEFAVTNGPDLVVVLSADAGGSKESVGAGLSLGALKANNGNQNYAIPAGTDTGRYASVIIYCKSFPTVFAYAKLEPAR